MHKTLLSLSEDLEIYCSERPTGEHDAQIKLLKKKGNELTDFTISVYANGLVTNDQARWSFTVKQCVSNIHESSAVYKIKTSSLTMEAKVVTDTLQ